MTSIHPQVIDGIERPCDNCDTVNHHWSEPTRADCQSYVPRQFTATNRAWEQMLAAARRLGLPERYTSDLFRDWESVTGNSRMFPHLAAPQQFVWAIYESGTHLVRLDPSQRSRRGEFAVTMFEAIVKNFGPRGMHWFNWNGHLLTECDPEKAREMCSDFDSDQMQLRRAA